MAQTERPARTLVALKPPNTRTLSLRAVFLQQTQRVCERANSFVADDDLLIASKVLLSFSLCVSVCLPFNLFQAPFRRESLLCTSCSFFVSFFSLHSCRFYWPRFVLFWILFCFDFMFNTSPMLCIVMPRLRGRVHAVEEFLVLYASV